MVYKALSKTLGIIIVVAVVVIALVSYIFILPTSTQPQYSKTLIFATTIEPTSLDIQQVTWATIIHSLLFQPLVTIDSNMNIVPDLSDHWEISSDGTEITFHIPENAKFSNGDPITAQAIKKSIERYIEISPYSDDYSDLAEIEVINNNTLKLVFNNPVPYIWPVLVSSYGAPVNAYVAEKIGNEAFGREAVGSGPYKVKEWVKGSHVVLVRNENYKTNIPFVQNKGPSQYIDEIIVRFIPEDLTRVTELEAGRVNIVLDVPLDMVDRLEGNPNIKLYSTISPGVYYLMLNLKNEKLSDLKVRQAIMIGINRTELALALGNKILPWYSLLSPTQFCYNSTLAKKYEEVYAYNPEKAKQLLREAGWVDTNGDGVVDKEGVPLKITLLSAVDDVAMKKVVPLIQAQLKKIGIDVEIREFTFSYIRALSRNWDFEIAFHRMSWMDPDILIYRLHSKIGNFTYANPEVDRLLELGRVISDETERAKVYSKVQEIVLEDLPFLPIFVLKNYIGVNKNVEGLIVHPNGNIFLNDARVKQG
ncbi:MAG: ABC transporter substrate-binding protein [Desulfurococcaceae archaeon]